jgi:hypothetical protein
VRIISGTSIRLKLGAQHSCVDVQRGTLKSGLIGVLGDVESARADVGAIESAATKSEAMNNPWFTSKDDAKARPAHGAGRSIPKS